MSFADFVPLVGYVRVNRETDLKYGASPLHFKVFRYFENLILYMIIAAVLTSLVGLSGAFAAFILMYSILFPLEYGLIRRYGDRMPEFFVWGKIKSMPSGDAERVFAVASWNSALMFGLGMAIGGI